MQNPGIQGLGKIVFKSDRRWEDRGNDNDAYKGKSKKSLGNGVLLQDLPKDKLSTSPVHVGAQNGYHLSVWRFFPLFYSKFWPYLRPIRVATTIVVL